MEQLNLPFLIPIQRNLTKKQKQEYLEQRYNEIIHAQNEDHFYSQLEQLRKVIES